VGSPARKLAVERGYGPFDGDSRKLIQSWDGRPRT